MDLHYVTRLHEQPLVVDLSEDCYEGGNLKRRPDYWIFWDGQQVENRWGDPVWRYKSVRIETALSYESVVKAIVRYRFTSDEVEAILLNAQLPPAEAGDKHDEYGRELADLQAWRAEAKRIADRVMATVGNNK